MSTEVTGVVIISRIGVLVCFWNSDIVAISFLNMCFWGANLSFCSFLVILKGRPAWWHDDVPLRHYSLPSRLHCVNDTGVFKRKLKAELFRQADRTTDGKQFVGAPGDSLYRHFTNSVCNVMPTGSCIKDVRLKWAREVCVKTGQQWMWCVGSGGQLVPPVLQVGLRMRLWPPIVRDNWWQWSCMELKQAKVKVNSFRSTFTYLKPTKMQDFYQKTMGTVPGGRWATPAPYPIPSRAFWPQYFGHCASPGVVFTDKLKVDVIIRN